MKRIIVFLLCLFTVLGASAQSIPQVNAVPWYQFNRKLSVDERLRLPLDTLSIGSGTSRDTSGLIAYKNGKVYYLKNSVWTEVGTGALSGDTLFIQNGPTSSFLKTLARVGVGGDTLFLKSIAVKGSGITTTDAGDSLTFSIPNASASSGGLLTTGTQSIAGEKNFTDEITKFGDSKLQLRSYEPLPGFGTVQISTTLNYYDFDKKILGNGDIESFGAIGATGNNSYYSLSGTQATSNRPSLSSIDRSFRWNQDSGRIEVYNGTTWRGLAYTGEAGSGGGSSGLPSFYDGLDTAQIRWVNNRNLFWEFPNASNTKQTYIGADSSNLNLVPNDTMNIGITTKASVVRFRNMEPSGDSVLYLDANRILRNKLLPDPNILVAHAGTGQNLWYDNNDTLTFKRLQSTYALTASSGTDSSLRYTIDTTLIATKQWATTYGFGGGGGGGTPGGSDTQVQFNDGGAFGGDAGFTYNKTSNSVTTDSLFLNRKIQVGTPPLDGFRNADVSIAFDASGTNAGLSIYNSSGTRILSILENGGIQWPQIFNNFSTLGLTFLGNNTKTFDANAIGGGLTPVWRYQSSTLTATSSQYFLEHIPTYAPTSDVAGNNIFAAQRIRPTINQTGGNDNVTTGLLIDPILTAAPNWRAIQTTSTSNFFGRIRQDESAQVTTTDATTTTIATIVLDTAGVVTEVDWTIKAEDGSGNIAVYKRLVRVKNVSGTLTILGTPDVIGTDFEDTGISSASIAFDVSGTSLRARATGIAATNINWRTVHTRRHL